MKKRWMLCMVVAVAVFLGGCSGGNVRNVHMEIGESTLYSPVEIEEAMDLVVKHFAQNFEGCTMTDLWYDEDYSQEWAEDWAEQYEAEEAIVLLSNFDVDGSGRSPSLNPNDTYRDWNWILVRSGDAWELKTWGYA